MNSNRLCSPYRTTATTVVRISVTTTSTCGSTQHLAQQEILQIEADVAHHGQERHAQGKQAGEKDADGGVGTELDTDIKLYKVQLSRRKLRLSQVLRSRRIAPGCRMDKGSSTSPRWAGCG